MTHITELASRFVLVALACAACKSDTAPSADWVRPWSAWDLTKWPPVCGPESRTYPTGRAWFKDVGEPPHMRCAVHISGDRVETVIISSTAPEADVIRTISGALAVLAQEMPPDVGSTLTQLVGERRNADRVVRGFEMTVRYESSALGDGLVRAHVNVSGPQHR